MELLLPASIIGCSGNCDPRSGGIVGGISGLTGCYQSRIDTKARDVEVFESYNTGLESNQATLASDVQSKKEERAALLKSVRKLSDRAATLRKQAHDDIAGTPDQQALLDRLTQVHQRLAELTHRLDASLGDIKENQKSLSNEQQELRRLEDIYRELSPTK